MKKDKDIERIAILDSFEKAARIYCERIGDDPDQELLMPGVPEGSIVMANPVNNTAPRWHFVAVELHDLTIRLLALKGAVQPAKGAH